MSENDLLLLLCVLLVFPEKVIPTPGVGKLISESVVKRQRFLVNVCDLFHVL